jgi:hypothetical protein
VIRFLGVCSLISGIALAAVFFYKLDNKPGNKPPQITMMATKSAEAPANLGILLVPDLKQIKVWSEKSLANK